MSCKTVPNIPVATPVGIVDRERTNGMIIPFGIFRNKGIEEVPSSYLVWLTDRDWFNDKFPDLSNEVVKELEWRDKFDRHIT